MVLRATLGDSTRQSRTPDPLLPRIVMNGRSGYIRMSWLEIRAKVLMHDGPGPGAGAGGKGRGRKHGFTKHEVEITGRGKSPGYLMASLTWVFRPSHCLLWVLPSSIIWA